VTDTGGEEGLVRDLPEVDGALLRALVDALGALETGFTEFAERLEAGTVHEHAFGKLVDAAKVRDAYHERLPATKLNLTEAGDVARSFLREFAAPIPSQRESGE
jgi:hypothetical protein